MNSDNYSEEMIRLETREAKVNWYRPWSETIWFTNPFGGQPIPVHRDCLPKSLLAKIEKESAEREI